VPRMEADLRAKDALLAEREGAWQAERGLLQGEIARLANGVAAGVVKPKAARAAAGAAAALEPAG